METTTEIAGYRTRVEAARRRLAELPREGWGELGPADAATGERWDRGHILGHLAEMLPYWTGQIRAGFSGDGALGRDDAGWAHRRAGIDGGRAAGVESLLASVDEGLAGLVKLLDRLSSADLERPLPTQGHLSERDHVDVRWAIEHMLIGHLEAHVHQLEEIT